MKTTEEILAYLCANPKLLWEIKNSPELSKCLGPWEMATNDVRAPLVRHLWFKGARPGPPVASCLPVDGKWHYRTAGLEGSSLYLDKAEEIVDQHLKNLGWFLA